MKNNIPYELIARYLAGECNEDEKLKIQEWGQLHPDIMDECTRIWQQTSSEEFNPDVAQALQKVNHRIDTKKEKIFQTPVYPDKWGSRYHSYSNSKYYKCSKS
ncbi:MAG: hypothetical protein LUH22_02075 [Bacteroides sp.]|nr:hypothetical protein [Bacteroides sp.]